MPNKIEPKYAEIESIEQADDGQLGVKLKSGEVYKGHPLDVIQEIGKSQVYTKRDRQEWKEKYEAKIAEPPPEQPPAADPTTTRYYLTDEVAQGLGYKSRQDWIDREADKQRRDAERNWKEVIATFDGTHPEFNSANDGSQKLVDRAFADYKLGSEYGFKNFDEFASVKPDMAITILDHTLAAMYHDGSARPMSPEEQKLADSDKAALEQQRNPTGRPTPPPVLPGKSPDGEQQGFNPYDTKNVPLEQLRAMAIQQELKK